MGECVKGWMRVRVSGSGQRVRIVDVDARLRVRREAMTVYVLWKVGGLW